MGLIDGVTVEPKADNLFEIPWGMFLGCLLDIWVPGMAKPQGSKKPFAYMKNGRPVGTLAEDNPEVKNWRTLVGWEARSKWGTKSLLDGPLFLRLDFYRLQPQSHLRANGVPKESSPILPDSVPDLSKLERAIEDALTGVVYTDDRKICGRVSWKHWGSKPGVRVRIFDIKGGQL